MGSLSSKPQRQSQEHTATVSTQIAVDESVPAPSADSQDVLHKEQEPLVVFPISNHEEIDKNIPNDDRNVVASSVQTLQDQTVQEGVQSDQSVRRKKSKTKLTQPIKRPLETSPSKNPSRPSKVARTHQTDVKQPHSAKSHTKQAGGSSTFVPEPVTLARPIKSGRTRPESAPPFKLFDLPAYKHVSNDRVTDREEGEVSDDDVIMESTSASHPLPTRPVVAMAINPHIGTVPAPERRYHYRDRDALNTSVPATASTSKTNQLQKSSFIPIEPDNDAQAFPVAKSSRNRPRDVGSGLPYDDMYAESGSSNPRTSAKPKLVERLAGPSRPVSSISARHSFRKNEADTGLPYLSQSNAHSHPVRHTSEQSLKGIHTREGLRIESSDLQAISTASHRPQASAARSRLPMLDTMSTKSEEERDRAAEAAIIETDRIRLEQAKRWAAEQSLRIDERLDEAGLRRLVALVIQLNAWGIVDTDFITRGVDRDLLRLIHVTEDPYPPPTPPAPPTDVLPPPPPSPPPGPPDSRRESIASSIEMDIATPTPSPDYRMPGPNDSSMQVSPAVLSIPLASENDIEMQDQSGVPSPSVSLVPPASPKPSIPGSASPGPMVQIENVTTVANETEAEQASRVSAMRMKLLAAKLKKQKELKERLRASKQNAVAPSVTINPGITVKQESPSLSNTTPVAIEQAESPVKVAPAALSPPQEVGPIAPVTETVLDFTPGPSPVLTQPILPEVKAQEKSNVDLYPPSGKLEQELLESDTAVVGRLRSGPRRPAAVDFGLDEVAVADSSQFFPTVIRPATRAYFVPPLPKRFVIDLDSDSEDEDESPAYQTRQPSPEPEHTESLRKEIERKELARAALEAKIAAMEARIRAKKKALSANDEATTPEIPVIIAPNSSEGVSKAEDMEAEDAKLKLAVSESEAMLESINNTKETLAVPAPQDVEPLKPISISHASETIEQRERVDIDRSPQAMEVDTQPVSEEPANIVELIEPAPSLSHSCAIERIPAVTDNSTPSQNDKVVLSEAEQTTRFSFYQPLSNSIPISIATAGKGKQPKSKRPSRNALQPTQSTADSSVLQGIIWSRIHQTNAHARICLYEENGGTCSNPSCKDLHLSRDFVPTQEDLFQLVDLTIPANTSAYEAARARIKALDQSNSADEPIESTTVKAKKKKRRQAKKVELEKGQASLSVSSPVAAEVKMASFGEQREETEKRRIAVELFMQELTAATSAD